MNIVFCLIALMLFVLFKSMRADALRAKRAVSAVAKEVREAYLKMRSVDQVGSVFLRQVLRRMKALGLNQSTLAQRMKVSRSYTSKVLRSDVNISLATAAKLAHALQMDFFPELRNKRA